jgi:hypothetical protein
MGMETAGGKALTERDQQALDTLELRLKTLLPEEYQDSYEEVRSDPMRSAALKYNADGTVAWDEIWGSFCDLAMAGGPPHKGRLLEPGSQADIGEAPGRYEEVTDEICRGIVMASELPAKPSPAAGWVRVSCFSETMADWMLRAITMENVAVRSCGALLELPAAPHFRLEKEIKNVVTVVAKTSHYWMGHLPRAQKQAIADVFARLAVESPLIAPGDAGGSAGSGIPLATAEKMTASIRSGTNLSPSNVAYAGWLGVDCPSVRAAVWMMRLMVVSNVLSRREGTLLFVPINAASDPDGGVVVRSLTRIHRLAAARGVL